MSTLMLTTLLSRIGLYLEGKAGFSSVRDWVYDYYEAERPFVLDEPLEEVFPVLLSYLQYEEAEHDPKRVVRIRRLYELLTHADSGFAERAVFALEFDEIRGLTQKLSDKVIASDTYKRKMATLSPAPYNVGRLMRWADAHANLNEPSADLT